MTNIFLGNFQKKTWQLFTKRNHSKGWEKTKERKIKERVIMVQIMLCSIHVKESWWNVCHNQF